MSRPFFSKLSRSFKSHRLFLLVSSLCAVVNLAIIIHFGAKAEDIRTTFLAILVSQLMMVFMLPVRSLVVSLPRYQGETILKKLSAYFSEVEKQTFGFFKTERGAEALILFLCIIPFFFSFIAGKSLIPFLHPFSSDPFLADMDHLIHFGHYPHTLLPGLSKTSFIISLSENIYLAWFIVLPVLNGYVIFIENDLRRRKIFFWTSLILWVFFGNTVATFFSSVGPIFYGQFYTGVNPYADLYADMLKAKDLGFLMWPGTVDLLSSLNARHIPCNLNGISAFPSMHIGASMLSCLYAFTISRKIGWLMAVFTSLILMSSIVLGFHYAVDGYFSILAVSFVWWALHRIIRT